jgi:chaperone BCS1
MLITAMSKYALLRQTLSSLKTYASSSVFASVSIPGSHPLNKQLLAWLVDQGLGKNARTLALSSPNAIPPGSRTYLSAYDDYSYLYGADGRRARSKRNLNAEEEDRQKQALSYVPEVGTYRFWWKWYPMTFTRQRNVTETTDSKGRVTYMTTTLNGSEPIVISCPSLLAGTRPIQEFLNHVKTIPAKDNTTTIYRPDAANSTWDAGITRPSRNLNAVTLDAAVKDDLIKDIETYLAPETRKYYANRGIPWRRGFLFYGNPGTGKTSFSNALAGHLNLNIYMISLSNTSLNDSMLEILFEQLPSKCIVLLEDIDSAGIQRENMRQQVLKAARRSSRRYSHEFTDEHGNPISAERFVSRIGGVTLSGLLNVLDGIHSKEGHVTIMTSNSPDSLDPALVRPGRIDRKVLFGYASREVIGKLFVHIFSKAPEELLESEKGGECRHDIFALADQFADIVPADRLTPAEVQGYLLVHREDPVEAVEQASTWVQKTLETKDKGVNVESFAGQEEAEAKEDKQNSKSRRKSKHDESRKTLHPDHRDYVGHAETVDDETTSQQYSSSSPTEDYTSHTTTPPSSYASESPPYEATYPPPPPTTYAHVPAPTALLPSAGAAVPRADEIRQFLQSAGIAVPATAPIPLPAPATTEQPANEVPSPDNPVKKKAKTKSKRK